MAALTFVTATIAQNASLSGAVYIGDYRYFAIQMPAAWTAAGLTFQGSLDGATYQNLYDDAGNEVSASAAASINISLDSVALKIVPYRYLKIRSGTAASAVNQEDVRVLTIYGKN
jgi:hypothetical protein